MEVVWRALYIYIIAAAEAIAARRGKLEPAGGWPLSADPQQARRQGTGGIWASRPLSFIRGSPYRDHTDIVGGGRARVTPRRVAAGAGRGGRAVDARRLGDVPVQCSPCGDGAIIPRGPL